MEHSSRLVAGQITDRLDKPAQRVAYLIRNHRLKPTECTGIIGLFGTEQVSAIDSGFAESTLGEVTMISKDTEDLARRIICFLDNEIARSKEETIRLQTMKAYFKVTHAAEVPIPAQFVSARSRKP